MVPPFILHYGGQPGRVKRKQVNAQGIIDAPPHVVRAVIADLERYPAFMPDVNESRVMASMYVSAP